MMQSAAELDLRDFAKARTLRADDARDAAHLRISEGLAIGFVAYAAFMLAPVAFAKFADGVGACRALLAHLVLR